MFAIVRLVGFLENGGSQILPSSHAFHREHATEIHGLGAVEIERSSRTARGFAR